MLIYLFVLLAATTAFPVNLTCKASHYPPEFYAKHYPVASAVAGYVWDVSCKEYTDTTGNLDWVKIPNGGFQAKMMSSFAHGGIFTVFHIIANGNIIFTTNITLYAVTDDPMYSPLSLCVWQTQEIYNQATYYVPLLESGANLYNDIYVQRDKQDGAPAFFAKNTEYFAVSKDGKFMSNQLITINPKTAKGVYSLTCSYDAVDKYPKQIGDWWEEPENSCCDNDDCGKNKAKRVLQLDEKASLDFVMSRYNLQHNPVDDVELVDIGRYRIPRSILKR